MCILPFERWLRARHGRSAGVAKVSRTEGKGAQVLDIRVDTATRAERVETKVQRQTSDR